MRADRGATRPPQTTLLEEEDLAGIPVLVYANKQDLLNAMTAAQVMEALDIKGEKSRWVHVEVRLRTSRAGARAESSYHSPSKSPRRRAARPRRARGWSRAWPN